MKTALIIGKGAREHALAWKVIQDSNWQVIFAPGNPGAAFYPNIKVIEIDPNNVDEVIKLVKDYNIDLVIVGPEDILANGIYDKLKDYTNILGPNQMGAKLESSKIFCKEFLQKYNLPTAKYEVAYNKNQAYKIAQKLGLPLVCKTDKLAGGKGVDLVFSKEDLDNALERLFNHQAGKDGLILEQYLSGTEISIFALCCGKNYIIFDTAHDYKKLQNNNLGPNTGGMGSYSPSTTINNKIIDYVSQNIIKPTLKNLYNNENINYCGFLYAGIMISNNQPYILEYNVRLGDPETQVLMPRLKTSLGNLCLQTAKGTLPHNIEWHNQYAVGVVLASKSYPYKTDQDNHIITLPQQDSENIIFTASVKNHNPKLNQVLSGSGRILTAVGIDNNINQAKAKAYNLIKQIESNNFQYRTDICS